MPLSESEPALKFGFLLHPRNQEDVQRFERRLPADVVRRAQENWSPVIVQQIRLSLDGRAVCGVIIAVPLTPAQMHRLPAGFVQERVLEAVGLAEEQGCEIVGLGAWTSIVTGGGGWIARKTHLRLTSGSAYTAAVTVAGLRWLAGDDLRRQAVAIVGASGSVGQCCAAMLAGHCAELLLVGRNPAALGRLVQRMSHRDTIRISTSGQDLGRTRVVVLCTASLEPVLESGDLANGTLVYDLTEPSSFRPEPGRTRWLQGGLVRVPGLRLNLGTGLHRDTFYACFAETLLWALDGRANCRSVGQVDVDAAAFLESMAKRYGIEAVLPPPERSV